MPTKMPACSLPVDQSVTERAKEARAATRKSPVEIRSVALRERGG